MNKPMAIKKERPLTGSFTDYLVKKTVIKDLKKQKPAFKYGSLNDFIAEV